MFSLKTGEEVLQFNIYQFALANSEIVVFFEVNRFQNLFVATIH